MLFSKQNLTKEVLIKDYKELYDSIISEKDEEIKGLNEKLVQTTHSLEKMENKEKILTYAGKLNLKNEDVKDLIDFPFNEAVIKMIDMAAPKLKNQRILFEKSAPPAVGTEPGSPKVKTFKECIEFVMNRDSIDAMNAARKAAVEFSEEFNKNYNYTEKEGI